MYVVLPLPTQMLHDAPLAVGHSLGDVPEGALDENPGPLTLTLAPPDVDHCTTGAAASFWYGVCFEDGVTESCAVT